MNRKYKPYRRIQFLLLVSVVLSVSFYYAVEEPDIKRIIEHLETFNSEYPQQKVYLHTDKSEYSINENIWIKAYVVNAIDHTPDTLSSNLYIDLVSPQNRTFNRLLLKLNKGIGYGDIALNIDSLPEGNYQLRAYTNWMRNFNNGLLFAKTIKIRNPNYQKYLERTKYVENKNLNKKLKKVKKKITVEFFPEGGTLLCDVENKVAFKASDGSGIGKDFNGIIVNEKGDEIFQIHTMHKGMGVFKITPENKVKYYLITNDFGSKIKVQLPEPLHRGYGLRIDNISDEESILIDIITNEKADYNEVANKVILIGQTRNKVFYSKKFNLPKKGTQLKVKKSLFPSGVTQFTLFNSVLQPVCERLVFINNTNNSRNAIKYYYVESDIEDYNKYSVEFGNAIPADEKYSISVSILNADSLLMTKNANIFTNLLLASDITGNIEDPYWYFSGNKNSIKALDLVMMINGWRRFIWKDIMANRYPEIEYNVENGITISGKITRFHFDIPINGSNVRLYILDQYNDFFEYETKEKGRFNFDGFEYYDTMNVKIEARTPANRKNLLIHVGETDSPEIIRYDNQYILAKQDKKHMVVPNYQKVVPEKYEVSSIHGTPDFVIDMDKINTDGYSNLFQVIEGRVPGVDVVGNDITIRGNHSFTGPSSPLVVLDGVPTDISALGSIHPLDVRYIEILKGPSTAIYGFRGANGVIAVYTRRGEYMVRGEITFQMLGYYTAREFYRPKLNVIENNQAKEIKSTTILWVPELHFDDKGNAFFYIKKDDLKEEMHLNLEGISHKGNIIIDYAKINK